MNSRCCSPKVAAPALVALFLAFLAPFAHADDFYLLESYYRLGRFQKALETIERIEKGEPGALPPNVMLIKADCLSSLDKPAEAVTTLEDLLARFPDSDAADPARVKMVSILETTNNASVLVAKLKTWAALEPSGQNAYADRLVDALTARNRRPEAVAWLEQSVNPAHWDILFDVLRKEGDLDAEVKRLAALSGKEANPRLAGTLLARANQWTAARPLLEKALAAAPSDRALALFMAGRAQEARDWGPATRYVETLLARAPEDPALLARLGGCLLAQGKKDQALGVFDRIRSGPAKDSQADQLYVKVLTEQGLIGEAVAGVGKARARWKIADLMASELAALLARLGRFREAVRELSHVLTEGPQQAAERVDTAQDRIREIARTSQEAYAQASAELTALATQRPGDLALLRVADDVLAARGDTGAREALGRSLARLLAGNPDELTELARDMADEDRIPLARAMVESLLPGLAPPRSYEVQLELAKLLANDRPREAVQMAQALDRPDRADVPASLVQSARLLVARVSLTALSNPDAAREILDKLLADKAPANQTEEAHVLMARAQTLLGDFTAARAHLSAVATTGDRDIMREALLRRGLIDLYEGKLDDARESLGQMVLRAPDAPDAPRAVEALYIAALVPPPPATLQGGGHGQTPSPSASSSEPASGGPKSPPPVAPGGGPIEPLPGQPTQGTSPGAGGSPRAAGGNARETAPAPGTGPGTGTGAGTGAGPGAVNWAGAFLRQRELLEAGQLERYRKLAVQMDPAGIPPGLKPHFALLSAMALRQEGKSRDAVGILRALVQADPQSHAAQQAMLLQADILDKDLADHAGSNKLLEEYLIAYPSSLQADGVRQRLESSPGEKRGSLPRPSPDASPALPASPRPSPAPWPEGSPASGQTPAGSSHAP